MAVCKVQVVAWSSFSVGKLVFAGELLTGVLSGVSVNYVFSFDQIVQKKKTNKKINKKEKLHKLLNSSTHTFPVFVS